MRTDFRNLPICAVCGPVRSVRDARGGRGVVVTCACGVEVVELPRRPLISFDDRLCRLTKKGRRWGLERIVPRAVYLVAS